MSARLYQNGALIQSREPARGNSPALAAQCSASSVGTGHSEPHHLGTACAPSSGVVKMCLVECIQYVPSISWETCKLCFTSG